MGRRNKRRVELPLGERGSVLVIALIIVPVIAIIAGSLLSLSSTEVSISHNEAQQMQAFYLAESGIADATRILRDSSDVDTQLAASQPFNCPAGLVPASDGGCTFTVENDAADPGGPTDDTNRRLIVTSTGTYQNASSSLEVILGSSPFPAAITMGCPEGGEDTLTINGNPNISGSMGSVHSNCNIEISGDPNVSQNVTASGTITIGGGPTIGGSTSQGVSPVPIPEVNPVDFKPLANYIMVETASPASAKIYDSDGFMVFDAYGTGDPWPSGDGGWEYSGTPGDGGKWVYVGDDTPGEVQGKTFYFQKPAGGDGGHAIIGSNPGTAVNKWQVTLVAEGHIDISGNPLVRANSENLFLVAGSDVKIGGNYESPWEGGLIIAAHEQVAFSGNPDFVGFVLIENAANDDNYVEDSFLSGNPPITYDGAPPPPANWFPLSILSWRELVN